MKHLFFCLALVLFAACSGEEELTPGIQIENDFEITENPDDSIQTARYEIYKEYNIPVYFNDTIARKHKGFDHSGNPFYTYETIDLNWTFYGYDRSVKYTYRYITDPHEQMNALRYVKEYLKKVSKPMRPFCIMLADTLTVSTRRGDEKPFYRVGFRTLVLAKIKDVVNKDTIDYQVGTIIKNMIHDRVKGNLNLCARFAAVCSEKGWYGRSWETLGECSTIVKWQKKSWTLSVNELYDEPPFQVYQGKDIVERLTESLHGEAPYVDDREEALRIRKNMIAEMGQYGFLRGWKNTGTATPDDDEEDRTYFVKAILHLGDKGFRRRYGSMSVIMEKYKILADFISQDLGVDLNYDGMSEEEKNEEYFL